MLKIMNIIIYVTVANCSYQFLVFSQLLSNCSLIFCSLYNLACNFRTLNTLLYI